MNPAILNLIKKLLGSHHIEFSYSTDDQRFLNLFSGLSHSNIVDFSNYDNFIIKDYCRPKFYKECSSLDVHLNDYSLCNLIKVKINSCSSKILEIYNALTTSGAMLKLLRFKVENYEKMTIPDSEILSLMLSDDSSFICNCDVTNFLDHFIASVIPIFQQVNSVTLVTKNMLKKVAKIGLCWNIFNPHYLVKLWLNWEKNKRCKVYFFNNYRNFNKNVCVSITLFS